jgi:hypothetical protein
MVKVQLGEPCGPGINYEKSIKNARLDFNELETILREVETNLDEIYQKLDESYSMLCYNIVLENGNNDEEKFVSGGIDLSVKEGRKYALPEFKQEYKRAFKAFLQNPENTKNRLSIEVSVTGFRDKITKIVEARDV